MSTILASRAMRPCVLLAAWGLAVVGCVPKTRPGEASTSAASSADPYTEAAAEAEPGEKPYLEASRPILTAIAARDYRTLYGLMSHHALAKVQPGQFGIEAEPGQPEPAVLEKLTQEQFLEWMQKAEEKLGKPLSVQHVYVQSVDPVALSGKGDPLDTMFVIGAMSADIPAEIRKASIRAQIRTHLLPEAVKQLAAEMKITEDQVRAGQWPEDGEHQLDEWPYLNLKFVLVEDQGALKVGYFEFMPPSMLD